MKLVVLYNLLLKIQLTTKLHCATQSLVTPLLLHLYKNFAEEVP